MSIVYADDIILLSALVTRLQKNYVCYGNYRDVVFNAKVNLVSSW